MKTYGYDTNEVESSIIIHLRELLVSYDIHVNSHEPSYTHVNVGARSSHNEFTCGILPYNNTFIS